jgi:hypothetical protein
LALFAGDDICRNAIFVIGFAKPIRQKIDPDIIAMRRNTPGPARCIEFLTGIQFLCFFNP